MCFFSAPQVQPAQQVAAATPPSQSDPEAVQSGDDRRRRAAGRKGRRSTILTGSQGDTAEANIGRRTLG